MNGGERTSLDSLDVVTPLADLGTVVECGAGGTRASVPEGNGEGPYFPGHGEFVLPRSPEVAIGRAGTMVTGHSQL